MVANNRTYHQSECTIPDTTMAPRPELHKNEYQKDLLRIRNFLTCWKWRKYQSNQISRSEIFPSYWPQTNSSRKSRLETDRQRSDLDRRIEKCTIIKDYESNRIKIAKWKSWVLKEIFMIVPGMTRYFRSYIPRSMIVEFRILDRLVHDDLPRIANSRMKDHGSLISKIVIFRDHNLISRQGTLLNT